MFLSYLPANAAEPPTAPILRIDPGEHTVAIRRIATDAAGRWLVTASRDKTARVWDLADGKLLTTLRPPIGAGIEGELNAVAMSPDGRKVAVGGFTGYGWDKSVSIYLFDRASGRLLRRLTGLPDAIFHLTFSPDGSSLAAALVGKHGLRLFDVVDGRLLGKDSDYGSDSYSVDFRPDGRRLLTTSFDGHVRIYSWEHIRLQLLAKQAAPGGQLPMGARFSPDGQRIAVGFHDSAAVNVLDGDDLSLLYAPDMAGLNAPLNEVAWSRDGDALFAAGGGIKNHQAIIRRWAINNNQAGRPLDWPVASDNRIMDLAPLPDGRLAFASAAPEWGVVTASGQRALIHDARVVADFRNNREGSTLSRDATQVRFGYEVQGRLPTVFDSQSRAFLAAGSAGLNAPRLSAPGLNISDWEGTFAPKLNGQSLQLRQYEMSRSLALFPETAGASHAFVLGTEVALRAFDRTGRETWLQQSGVVWAVNVSGDGRWVVAYSDGIIRWHRATDGVEQMAFYPHPDKKRWVLWTPSGYYDASPGAEDLIGWYVNNGKDAAADFYPASRFRDTYYRPDIIDRILVTRDEAEAVKQANAAAGRKEVVKPIQAILPPVIELVSPLGETSTSSDAITIRYRVRSNAPVTSVRVRVNGQVVETRDVGKVTLASESKDGIQSLTIPLPRIDSEVQLFASNEHGTSTPAGLRVSWTGAKESFVIKPKLYILAVGVADYKDVNVRQLRYPAKDVADFVDAMKAQKGLLYRDVEFRKLTNAQATKEAVLDGLEWLQKQVTQHDIGMVFLAGHGDNVPSDKGPVYYFLPHDAALDRLKRTGVVFSDIRDTLSNLAGKSVLFLDTCHAGNVTGGMQTRNIPTIDTNAIVNELTSAENGAIVFAASTGRQFSMESTEWGNGAFTKALVEGLNGKAALGDSKRITHKMLSLYISDRVKALTEGKQHPTNPDTQGVPDFPLAVKR